LKNAIYFAEREASFNGEAFEVYVNRLSINVPGRSEEKQNEHNESRDVRRSPLKHRTPEDGKSSEQRVISCYSKAIVNEQMILQMAAGGVQTEGARKANQYPVFTFSKTKIPSQRSLRRDLQ
jgi:hypothetical protein